MKAIISTKHGSANGLQLREVEKPVPKENEVLIRVHAATVTAGDVVLQKMHPLLFIPLRLFGMRRKKIPGHEFAGVIEAVGAGVKRLKVGDEVFGTTTGLSTGANAEYVCLPQEWPSGVLALKPANLSFDEAAAVPVAGMAALYLLKKGDIQPGDEVLIYGASGSVGTYAVQLASYFGAKVSAVCSTANVEMVRSLGADTVIDYTKEDYTQSAQKYNVIFDAVGKTSSSRSKDSLKEDGTYLTVQSSTSEEIENLLTLKELIEAGAIQPVIDRTYPLEQVPEAHMYVETGRKKGNVIITIAQPKNN